MISDEQQLAPAEVVVELAEGLNKVAGLPLDLVVPPLTLEQVEIAKTPAAEIAIS